MVGGRLASTPELEGPFGQLQLRKDLIRLWHAAAAAVGGELAGVCVE
jgi:hypothetical protein